MLADRRRSRGATCPTPTRLDVLRALRRGGRHVPRHRRRVRRSAESEELIGRFFKDYRAATSSSSRASSQASFPRRRGRRNFGGSPKRSANTLENSLKRLGVERLFRPHTTPLPALMELLKSRGIVGHASPHLRRKARSRGFSASVESVAEAEECLEETQTARRCNVIFTPSSARRLRQAACSTAVRSRGVAIIVRLPLASGLLAGKYTPRTTVGPSDHRTR